MDFDKLTKADQPWLEAYLASHGGVYICPAMAKAAAAEGFVEGVHFHIVKPIPVSSYGLYVSRRT